MQKHATIGGQFLHSAGVEEQYIYSNDPDMKKMLRCLKFTCQLFATTHHPEKRFLPNCVI